MNDRFVISRWRGLFARCGKCPAYLDVRVCDEWQTLAGFWLWLKDQPFSSKDYQIDKDLIGNGKLYGPNHCVMVPAWLNSFLAMPKASKNLPLGVHAQGFNFYSSAGEIKSNLFPCLSQAASWYHSEKMRQIVSKESQINEIDNRIFGRVVSELSKREGDFRSKCWVDVCRRHRRGLLISECTCVSRLEFPLKSRV